MESPMELTWLRGWHHLFVVDFMVFQGAIFHFHVSSRECVLAGKKEHTHTHLHAETLCFSLRTPASLLNRVKSQSFGGTKVLWFEHQFVC